MSKLPCLYVRDEDADLWAQAERYAAAIRQSVSFVVTAALREYLPGDIRMCGRTEPGFEPTFDDEGTPMLVYGRRAEHGWGWTLWYLEDGTETAGAGDHFIPGGPEDAESALAAARSWLELRRRGDIGEMEEITLDIGEPALTIGFTGRWLVVPDSDETRTGEDGYDLGAYWGVALTKRGRIAVYTAHCNEGWPATLRDFDSLDDAAKEVPADILALAAAELGQERIIWRDI